MDDTFCKPSVAFPNGLFQPHGCARFGLDALLLGSFTARILMTIKGQKTPICDLGAGCGAALFSFLPLQPEGDGIGVEKEKTLLDAALINAKKLGLEEKAKFIHADLDDLASQDAPQLECLRGQLSLVMANPPWHEPGAGRAAPQALKAAAHMRAANDFFCASASSFLRHHGYFAAIIPSALLGQFHLACQRNKLGMRQVLPVATAIGKGASRLLLLVQKNARDDARFLPQLQIHHGKHGFTPEAQLFCPWLQRKNEAI